MGKISDIWVRLGLKKNEFDRGMDDAAKKTERTGGKMTKMLNAAKAGWAAVGAAVIAFGREMINATNKVGDAWAHTWAAIKGGWQSVLADISNYKPDFSSVGNFFKGEWDWIRKTFGNAKEAGEAAREASKAFDAEFELVNSVKLQKQMIQNQLNDLYVTMRDTTLSPADRKAAAERYKALLQPLADAEVRIYGNMMEEAAKEWQAGAGLSRQYSAQELTQFFSTYGVDAEKATAMFPELQAVYESRKGDKANKKIYDIATQLASASSEISQIDKEISRTYLSIKKAMEDMFNIGSDTTEVYLTKTLKDIKDEVAEDVRAINEEFKELGDIDLEIDLSDVDNDIQAFLKNWEAEVMQVAQLNGMLEDSFVQAMGNGLQALTDMMFGMEKADAGAVLAAFIAPFGDMAKNMGSLIMSYGISMEAFKKAFTNPYVAIAAGAGLMAIGAAISSGAQRISQGSLSGGSSTAYTGGSYGSTELTNYESTLTVEVVGRISGSDILLAGQNQQNKWNR